jgi:hypothetical protein
MGNDDDDENCPLFIDGELKEIIVLSCCLRELAVNTLSSCLMVGNQSVIAAATVVLG